MICDDLSSSASTSPLLLGSCVLGVEMEKSSGLGRKQMPAPLSLAQESLKRGGLLDMARERKKDVRWRMGCEEG